tara:strand:+ start:1278 stop:1652 length:375 start_codon:yes stop_codon:yes gene_type:complete
MDDIVVTSENGNGFNVTNVIVEDDGGISVTVGAAGGGVSGVGDVQKLTELLDVDSSNLSTSTNKFVLTYDSGDSKFKFINPDDVIDSAVGITTTDPAPSGLSDDTIDYLDEVLDNKIDLDAGEW